MDINQYINNEGDYIIMYDNIEYTISVNFETLNTLIEKHKVRIKINESGHFLYIAYKDYNNTSKYTSIFTSIVDRLYNLNLDNNLYIDEYNDLYILYTPLIKVYDNIQKIFNNEFNNVNLLFNPIIIHSLPVNQNTIDYINNPVNTTIECTFSDLKHKNIKIKEYLNLISRSRFESSKDPNLNISKDIIVQSIYNEFNGSLEGLELLISIFGYDSLIRSIWNNYIKTDHTINMYNIYTIMFYAKLDNEKVFNSYNKMDIDKQLKKCVSTISGDFDIAELIYKINPYIIISAGIKLSKYTLYMFNGTFYEICDDITIIRYILDNICILFERFYTTLDDVDEIKKCCRIISKLKNANGQNSIIKQIVIIFNIPNFESIRDKNPYIFTFKDCIYDAHHMSIRSGIPGDLCTIHTGYTFIDEYNKYKHNINHDDIQWWINKLKMIIRNEEKYTYLMIEFAARLVGKLEHKRKLILFGLANNGKSVLISALCKVLGPIYAPTVSSTLLYAKDSEPDKASPQMAPLRDARLIVQSEVTDINILNEGLVKRITGNDQISYRRLFDNEICYFTPHFLPVTVCNTFPKLNGNSPALKERIRVCNLTSKFVQKDYMKELNIPEHEYEDYMSSNDIFFIDDNINREIDIRYKALMFILIDIFESRRKLSETIALKNVKPINADTLEFFKVSNVYWQFKEKCIEDQRSKDIDSTNKTITTINHIYGVFKNWYKDNVKPYGVDSYEKFVREMEYIGYKSSNNLTYYGVKVKAV